MTTATLILVANHRFPPDDLTRVVAKHRQQKLRPQITIAYIGEPPTDFGADKVVVLPAGLMTLSRPRNLAAKNSGGDWLIFSDADTHYSKELHDLLNPDCPIVRGHRRVNQSDFDTPTTESYEVVAAPMIIKHQLFDQVGGYHEGYYNYGHEDADFLHKLLDLGYSCSLVDAGAIHILAIHHLLAGDDWQRGLNNDKLFETRLAIPVQDRVAQDVIDYNSTSSDWRLSHLTS